MTGSGYNAINYNNEIIFRKNELTRMQKIIPLILSLFVATLVTSCASTSNNKYMPVFHSMPRVSTLGFSVTPPPGRNWYEKVNDGSIFYLKKIEPKNYFIYTKASEIHFDKEFADADDFLKFVKESKGINTAPDVYKNGTADYASRSVSAICVEYHHKYEDHSMAKLQRRGLYANVRSNGVICIHPHRPDIGIDIFYLERTIAGNSIDVSYAKEGEEFLGSLSFL